MLRQLRICPLSGVLVPPSSLDLRSTALGRPKNPLERAQILKIALTVVWIISHYAFVSVM